MSDKRSPLEELTKAIERGFRPLMAAIARLEHKCDQLIEQGQKPGPSAAPQPEVVFDMETAIKDKGLWECGELHCRGCPSNQNLACALEYDLLDAGALPDQLHGKLPEQPGKRRGLTVIKKPATMAASPGKRS